MSDVSHVLCELHFAVLWFCALDHSVKLDGLCIYRPDVELNGTRTIHCRVGRGLFRAINLGPFHAVIENSAVIGIDEKPRTGSPARSTNTQAASSAEIFITEQALGASVIDNQGWDGCQLLG